jgi:predicted phosphate transport protein (TIGR00153 family)
MPKEENFFELFNQHVALCVQGSKDLYQLINDLPNAAEHSRAIQASEKKADKITHETIDLLHKTFITPLDRDEIHKLITTMDDILDLMEDVAEVIQLYDVTQVTPEAIELARICEACCERVNAAVLKLNDMRNAKDILRISTEIDMLESDADRVMRSAISQLFRNENDFKRLMKLKAVYELLETITDKCEDVANILEGIVLENA